MSKRNAILLIILAGFIIFIFFIADPLSRNDIRTSNEFLFQDIHIESIDRINIFLKDDDISLIKRQNNWFIKNLDDYPADNRTIDQLFDNLSEIRSGRISSRNMDNLERYGLSPENTIRFNAYSQEQPLIAFNIGNIGADRLSTFIRVKGEDLVRLIPGNIRHFYNKPLGDWRDRNVIDLSDHIIGELEIITEEYSINIFIDDSDNFSILGTEDEDLTLNDETISGILRTLKPLRADGFFEDEENIDDIELYKEEPLYTINITTADKQHYSIYIIGKNPQNTRFFVTDNAMEYKKVLFSRNFERLFPKYDKLIISN